MASVSRDRKQGSDDSREALESTDLCFGIDLPRCPKSEQKARS